MSEAATKQLEDAVKKFERLYRENPKHYAEDYGQALHDYGVNLLCSKKGIEALPICEQAIDIREGLYRFDPVRYAKDYGDSLDMLISILLYTVFDTEAALLVCEKSIAVREFSYGLNPKEFAGVYVDVLFEAGLALSGLTKNEEAFMMYKKALPIQESLYRDDPKRGIITYEGILNCYSFILSQLGKYREAVDVSKQLMRLYEEINLKSFAMSSMEVLHRCIQDLLALGDYEEALAYTTTTLAAAKKMHKSDDKKIANTFYINYLNSHVLCLIGLERFEEALGYAEEAVDIWKESYESYLFSNGSVLNSYSRCLFETGQVEQALEAVGKALLLLEQDLLEREEDEDKSREESVYKEILANKQEYLKSCRKKNSFANTL